MDTIQGSCFPLGLQVIVGNVRRLSSAPAAAFDLRRLGFLEFREQHHLRGARLILFQTIRYRLSAVFAEKLLRSIGDRYQSHHALFRFDNLVFPNG